MNQIQTNTEKKETVLADAINTLKPAIQRLEENEKTIGKQLTNALQQAKLQENTIGTCPVCHVGKCVANLRASESSDANASELNV